MLLIPQRAKSLGQTLVMMVGGGCWAPGCMPEAPFKQFENVVAIGWTDKRPVAGGKTAYILSAGTYRLVAVADGAPMTARIRFNGLPGSADVSPRGAIKTRHLTFESSGGPAGFMPYHSAGEGPFDVDTPLGFMYSVRGQRWEPYVVGYEGDCFFRDSAPPLGTYLPGCPMSFDGVRYSVDYPGPVYYGETTAFKVTTEPGSWTHGGWKLGAGGTSWIRLTQLWLELGSQEVPTR